MTMPAMAPGAREDDDDDEEEFATEVLVGVELTDRFVDADADAALVCRVEVALETVEEDVVATYSLLVSVMYFPGQVI